MALPLLTAPAVPGLGLPVAATECPYGLALRWRRGRGAGLTAGHPKQTPTSSGPSATAGSAGPRASARPAWSQTLLPTSPVAGARRSADTPLSVLCCLSLDRLLRCVGLTHPQSQLCLPAFQGLLTPMLGNYTCPGPNERFDLRARPFGCSISCATVLSAGGSAVATLVVVLLILVLATCFHRCCGREKLEDEDEQQPSWWQRKQKRPRSSSGGSYRTDDERNPLLLDGSLDRPQRPDRRFRGFWSWRKMPTDANQERHYRHATQVRPLPVSPVDGRDFDSSGGPYRDGDTFYGTAAVYEEFDSHDQHEQPHEPVPVPESEERQGWATVPRNKGKARKSAADTLRSLENRTRAIGPTRASRARSSLEHIRSHPYP